MSTENAEPLAAAAATTQALRFEKWHGLGNDFVVVFEPSDERLLIERVGALCDRHRGVGADGVLVVRSTPPSMRVLNADGSEPEMCGNGLRCVAAALSARRGQDATELAICTGAGVLRCAVSRGAGSDWSVTVEAGRASFVARDAGVASDLSDVVLEAHGLRGLVASIGNPHWIFFDPPPLDRLVELGPKLEVDARFANRTNVEWVRPLEEGRWQVDVWERGVGITQACGTGATAVACALVRTGRAPVGQPLAIALPGGDLTITVDNDGAATVRGPATRVFSGALPL